MLQLRRVPALSVLVVVLLFVSARWNAPVFGAGTPRTNTADAFEPDDIAPQASTLTLGVAQAHTFHVDGDEDWAGFEVELGQAFTVATTGLDAGVNTVLTLYDENGETQLAQNDDSGEPGSLASRLTYTATVSGFLYVKVTDFNGTASGAYTLTLNDADDSFEVDDTPALASVLSPGLQQAHTFNRDGDDDWAKFAVISGRKYTIYTSRLGQNVDTIMELYASNGITLLDANDDGATDSSSRIGYTATETGFYFVRIRQFDGVGNGAYALTLAREAGVYLDTDRKADVLTYDGTSGNWARQISNGAGGFVQSLGNWSPGWSVLPATFNDDALTDVFLFNTTTGAWAKMLNDGGSGFTTQATGGWWPGWERYVMDLDGDGISDFFLYDPATGVWFRCLSTPTGFTYQQGGWNPGWEIYPMSLNHDQLGDMFLINRTTGRWFWVLGDSAAGFTYPVSETWFPGWVLYPGDFNGDGLSDFLLHDPPTGTYFVALTGETGFTYVQGGWSLGWTPHVADLDGDGSDDLFLHAATTGKWFEMISDDAGNFVNAGGETWSLGWTLAVSDFNGDQRADMLLYDPSTGVWYQALNLTLGSFSYGSGTWNPGLQVVVRPPIR